MNIEKTNDYREVIERLKERIAEARLAVLKAVNRELIGLYWEIGRTIVEKQEELGWGENIVEQIARDLQAELPGVRGFSRRNLINMRRYYLTYRDDLKVQTLSAQLPWSHNTLILEACKTAEERAFYLEAAARLNLSYRALERQVRGGEYGRYLLNQTNFPQTLAPVQAERAPSPKSRPPNRVEALAPLLTHSDASKVHARSMGHEICGQGRLADTTRSGDIRRYPGQPVC
jgi:predicted nuclease of restriction endonuclease-like (RecB) superfamily